MSQETMVPRGFGSFLGVFVLGATAGAVAALLMAPRSGRETRAQLKNAALDLKQKMERAPESMREAGDRVIKAGVTASRQAIADVTRGQDLS
jgi:gas vesicle protein